MTLQSSVQVCQFVCVKHQLHTSDYVMPLHLCLPVRPCVQGDVLLWHKENGLETLEAVQYIELLEEEVARLRQQLTHLDGQPQQQQKQLQQPQQDQQQAQQQRLPPPAPGQQGGVSADGRQLPVPVSSSSSSSSIQQVRERWWW